ncbi:hypothetical protein J2Z66_000518 [Paenibacillus eucommiae]|uniref:Uncharacterized protein n=1 Tax=Paenibacillus eucommiae TaxID=1355755 RepID=A0ABS4IMX8_9BACL|nr:hypothetical protein [Paenibacillus eucommiae]
MRSTEHREIPDDMMPNMQDEDEDSYYLPPRKVIHPSENSKWTKIFYQTLLWLFILLVVGLTIWGTRLA